MTAATRRLLVGAAQPILTSGAPRDGRSPGKSLADRLHLTLGLCVQFERVSYVTHLLMKALFRPSEELNRRTDQVQVGG